ncbi:hypothetical protein KIK06_20810 [Nocardiopsis sp. EMB25]|uniref:hypothetical protein n=1 Tax=Nocardiopsis TaxID=2013 RepID=UPI000345B3F5|nr:MULTISPECIES: hypothetical protein [Nocardiopsis]MCY9786339.1 hypothetical protein [Nocardiopsis sp. EMB25]
MDTTTNPQPLPLAPRAADCSNCNGSGKIFNDQDGNGPWKKEIIDCPLCNGTGQV